jgi:hypothetical protein
MKDTPKDSADSRYRSEKPKTIAGTEIGARRKFETKVAKELLERAAQSAAGTPRIAPITADPTAIWILTTSESMKGLYSRIRAYHFRLMPGSGNTMKDADEKETATTTRIGTRRNTMKSPT